MPKVVVLMPRWTNGEAFKGQETEIVKQIIKERDKK